MGRDKAIPGVTRHQAVDSLDGVPAHGADLQLRGATVTETLVFAGQELHISKTIEAEGASIFLDTQPLEGSQLDWAWQDLLRLWCQL